MGFGSLLRRRTRSHSVSLRQSWSTLRLSVDTFVDGRIDGGPTPFPQAHTHLSVIGTGPQNSPAVTDVGGVDLVIAQAHGQDACTRSDCGNRTGSERLVQGAVGFPERPAEQRVLGPLTFGFRERPIEGCGEVGLQILMDEGGAGETAVSVDHGVQVDPTDGVQVEQRGERPVFVDRIARVGGNGNHRSEHEKSDSLHE